MNMYGTQGRNRNLYGTVRSLVPSRATPLASGVEDFMYTAPYFYHIPPPQSLNTYPGRKRRKRVSYFTLFPNKKPCASWVSILFIQCFDTGI